MTGQIKNILHLTETSDTGGAENMIISLVENLDRNRYKSAVCLLRDGWLNTQLQRRGIETIIIPQPHSLDFVWLYRVYRLLKDRPIHVMHSHEFAMNVYGSFLSMISGIPIVTTVHGKNYYCDKWRRRAAYRFVARHSALVAVSDDLKRFVGQQVAIPLANIRVVHNGIDLARYAIREGTCAVREELRISPEQCVIGTVGNLFAVKGQTYLLKAYKTVLGQFPDSVLLIAGEGDQLGLLTKEASDLGIAGNVKFLGFRNDVPSILQAMDVFVLPSLSEGLPLSILEALALQKPVVATNVGGVSEIMENGVNGYIVPPKNPEALADRILLLLREPEAAVRMGRTGRKRVEDAFSLVKMVREYEFLYFEEKH